MDEAEQISRKVLIKAVVLIVILGLALYGLVSFLFPHDEPEESTPLIELKADAGEDKSAFTGEEVKFDGSNSTGNIVKYSWDFDRIDGISEDATGSNVAHIFEEYGDYRVTLTVTDVNGNTSKDFLIVHVNYRQINYGTIYPAQIINETFPIDEGVWSLYVVLEYPSQPQSGIGMNELDLSIWNPDDEPVADTRGQDRDSGDTQMEEINITDFRELSLPGDWTAEIDCDAGGAQGVAYTLTVEVYY